MSNNQLTSLLNACREMLIAQISGALPDVLNKMEQELQEKSDLSMEREARNAYKEASTALSTKKSAFPFSFKWAMLDEFSAKLAGKPANKQPGVETSGLNSLSLLDKDDQDEDLAVSKSAKNVREACGEELTALTRRVGKMMDKPELELVANPLGPDAIFTALQQATTEMQLGLKAKTAFYERLEKHLTPEIKDMYAKINAHLIHHGVLPQIQFSAGSAQASRSYASNRAPGATQVNAPPKVDNSVTASPDLFAQLQQLVAFQQTPQGMQTQIHRPNGQMNTPLHTQLRTPGAPMQTPLGAQLRSHARRPNDGSMQMPGATPMEALNNIQHGDWGALAQQIGIGDDATAAAVASGSINVLHEIRNTPIADNLGQVDAMTIDIIAMLFDYVLGDRRIPAVVRALLGRLQIPILKVAILDKAFFASKSHPARKLIDTIASSAIGINPNTAREDRMYKKIETAVEKVLAKFDSDVEIFIEVLADFEQYIEKDTEDSVKINEHSTKVVEEREKLEIGNLVSHKEVLRRTVGAQLPQPVEAFLNGPWSTAMAITYADHGDESQQWNGLIATMDDLVWSITPKANSDERKKLVSLLPYMLKRLQEGMNVANLQPTLRDQFLTALVDCHSVAVKAGLRTNNPELSVATRSILDQGATAIPQEEPTIKSVSFADAPTAFSAREGSETKVETQESVDAAGNVSKFVKRHVSQDNVDMVEIRLNEEDRSLVIARSDDFDQIVANMKRGAWVEFKMDDGSANRARLTWVSPLKGIYLFTNHQGFSGGAGHKPISISPQALSAQLRNGEAEIIPDDAMVDSAMSSMIDNLQQPPPVPPAQKTVANRPQA
jgi:outer membrane lipopolysaccharide assembly protein LptE/RlpB